MRAIDIIEKKRDNQTLTDAEIRFFVQNYSDGNLPDYQASAWAMAVLINGMTSEETTSLTLAMVDSGETLDLSGVVDIALDKHSTGGVGDKTTLVVEPVVAATGLRVGKMSGRGLGFSGGTLDKMESIPGFRTELSKQEFLDQLKNVGLVLAGQTASLAPADKKFYALRDVTGTVPSLPLIASSIMSKKIAAGAQRMVLDVKIGVGAFMESLEDARALAEIMVDIARLADRQAVALLSDMNQPLGMAVGNSLEVKESIETLQGAGPKDFRDHALEVASQLIILGEKASSEEEAREIAAQKIEDGTAWQRFRDLVSAQDGDLAYVDDPNKLPQAKLVEDLPSPQTGFLSAINARVVGETSVALGAGRSKKEDEIDLAVGIMTLANVGDKVEKDQALFTIHANDHRKLEKAKESLQKALSFSADPVDPLPLFYGIVK